MTLQLTSSYFGQHKGLNVDVFFTALFWLHLYCLHQSAPHISGTIVSRRTLSQADRSDNYSLSKKDSYDDAQPVHDRSEEMLPEAAKLWWLVRWYWYGGTTIPRTIPSPYISTWLECG